LKEIQLEWQSQGGHKIAANGLERPAYIGAEYGAD
jgi:hypothetical protein